MNTKTILSLLLVISLALISCKKELEPQESYSNAEVVTPNANTPTPVTPTPVTPTQMQQNNTVANPNTATPTSVAKGMNPAHGQPGHRCDIPVGAPLNSPAGKTATPQAATQLKQSENSSIKVSPSAINADGKITPASNSTYTTSGTPAILNTTAATPAGMNPPHGQAGHRCDVAVGAPLPK